MVGIPAGRKRRIGLAQMTRILKTEVSLLP